MTILKMTRASGEVLPELPLRVLARRYRASLKTYLWIKTLALSGALTFGMLACSGATAGTPAHPQSETPSPAPQQTYEGMIADSHCGAKHSAAIGKTASDCTRACVHAGAQFVLVDGDTVYLLEGDLAALKQVAGERVKLVGSLNGNRISITSIIHV